MKKTLFLLIAIIGFITNSFASHVMGGDITYTCVGGNNYLVTLTLYRDCFGVTIGTTPQNINLASSCGNFNASLNWDTTINVSQICSSATSTCNGGTISGVEQYVFSGIVAIPPCTDWVMSWSLCCRNNTITNLVSPDLANLFLKTTLNNVVASCNNSPQFLALPTPILCPNQLSVYNFGAYDLDGDSLYYQFTTPLNGPGDPIAFSGGYSVNNPIITSAGMNLNSSTGEVCFSPSYAQVCVVSILVSEYRDGVLIGTQLRDMQIIVSSTCTNGAPYSGSSPVCGNIGGISNLDMDSTVVQIDANSFSMCPLDSIYFEISISDPDTNNVMVSSNISSSIPGAILTIVNNGTQNPIVQFGWRPTQLDAGLNSFVLNLLDDACPITASQYYSYDFTVKEQPFAGDDLSICGSEWAQLNASGGAGYVWSVLSGEPLNTGVNITCNPCSNPQVKPSITTTYLLTSSLPSACRNTDTITITVAPDFNIFPFGDTVLCDYLTVPIGVNVLPSIGTYTYSWSPASTLNNSTISSPSASPTATTTYVATVTSPFGCVKKDSVTVGMNPIPTLTIRPGDTTVCLGSSLNFDLQSNCTYTLEMFDSFGDGWNGQTISVYDNSSLVGTYTFTTGLSNSVTFPITSGNTITLVYGIGSFQSESSFNLINGQGATQFSVAVGSMAGWVNGQIIYTGFGNCGPTLSDYTFNWSPTTSLSASNIQNPVATPLTTTTYTVTLNDTNGCVINRSQTITVVPDYTLNTSQSATSVCLGETVVFNAIPTPSGTYNYSWTPASIMDNPTSANPTATYTTSGVNTIIVDIDNGGGCMKSDTMYVTVLPSYGPNIDILNNDTIFGCAGIDSLQIDLDLGGSIPTSCGASISSACSGSSSINSVGDSTGVNTSTSWPAPYGNWYRNAKHQFLYTATELNAMGFVGGKITQIGWQVTAINGTTTYNDYTIKMKCSNLTNITTLDTGLTQVFNPKPINIVVGMNMHVFDVAYEWDGVSNLVVEICYNNLATTYTNNSITPWKTTTFTSSIYYYSDSSPACASTSTNGNSFNRPITMFSFCSADTNFSSYTYSWIPTTGVSNPTVQNPVLKPNLTTNYFVTVYNSFGCASTDSILITLDTCTVVNELNENVDIIIYPNPSTGVFTISKSGSLKEKLTIKLYSLEGKLIIEKIFQENEQSIVMDISEQSKGIYYLQLIMNENTFVKKILKD